MTDVGTGQSVLIAATWGDDDRCAALAQIMQLAGEVPNLPMPVLKHQLSHVERRPLARNRPDPMPRTLKPAPPPPKLLTLGVIGRCIARDASALHTGGMPLQMDISPLHRLVVIVARGHITPEEISGNTRRLLEANVPSYAKIIDVSQANSELTREQVQKVADLLRGAPDDTTRGPVAFVVNPARVGFADVFADVTKGERPIRLFRSLHEARAWLQAKP